MRIFKIGLTEIEDNPSIAHLTPSEVQTKLSSQFPELKNATMKESTRGDDSLYEWTAAAGRKG